MLIKDRVAQLLGGTAALDPAQLLDSSLLISVGRPWQLTRPGLRSSATESGPESITVTGKTAVGDLAVRVTLRPEGDRLSIMIDWRNDGVEPLEDLAVGLVIPAATGARITIPQVIYHDNPSADPELTIPHVGRGGFVTQAHRLPIPAVCAEREGEALIVAAEPADAAGESPAGDHRGSLGAIADHHGTTIIAASGVIMFDGTADVDYVHKAKIGEHADGGYLTLPPGGLHRQRLVLDRTRNTPPGQGYRQLINFAEEFCPAAGQPEPDGLSRAETIRLKTAALDARWFADGEAAGFLKFPSWGEPRQHPGRPDHDFLYGWTGQCLRLAWCDAWLGQQRAERWRIDRCRQVVDFYLRGSATGVDGLRWNHYVHDDRRWDGFTRGGAAMISARAHGETLVDLTDIVELFDRIGEPVPDDWRAATTTGAEFVIKAVLPDGIVPIGWRSDGSPIPAERGFAGAPAAEAVARAALLADDDRFVEPAVDLAEAFHRLPGAGFERPYAFSTLDAACEDKEAGMAYLRLLLALHRLTGEQRYLDRAVLVADWLLTWVYHWSPGFEPGTMLYEAGFRARGWPGVSVQNHHLDVFFPTHDVWRLGRLTGEDRLCRWAIEIDVALRQGICTRPGEWGFDVVGEQTEAFFVTDWQQRGAANTWNPSWVIALPLWQALLLQADDVLDPVR